MKKNKIIVSLFFSLFSIASLWAGDVTATILNESGSNTADGRISLTVMGGVAPYSYTWSGPNGFTSTEQNIYNLTTGLYSVTVSDALCGNAILTNLEVEPCFFQQTHEITAVCGNVSGGVKISLQNGLPPYAYTLGMRRRPTYTNSDQIEFNNLSVGDYSIKVSDARGCRFSLPIAINNAPPVGVYQISSTPSCPNNPDGDLFTSTSGGTPPFKFNWSNGTTTQQLNYVLPGTYTVTVTDRENCKTEQSFDVGTSPSTVQPHTNPCGYITYCKGIGIIEGNSPLREQNNNGNCSVDHICTTTNQVVYTTSAQLYQQSSSGCTIDYVCSISGEVMFSTQGAMSWQSNSCCCSRNLICSATGENLGYEACGLHLEVDANPQCCGIIWMVCDCSPLRAVYMRQSGCGETPDCQFTGDKKNQSESLKIFTSDGYIYYVDPKTKKHHAITIDDISSKKYKKDFPNMPDINLNEKMAYNGDSVTLYSLLRPKSFSFSVNPNPFETNLTLSLYLTAESLDKTVYVSVTNELGQIVGTYQYNDLKIGENELKPNLSSLNSGMYFISIRVKVRVETKKVYKK